jgi:3-oxoacyl-[acyl-carrier protein] reductase
MELGLGGRVAIVGGSSRGLGRAIAEELAQQGVDLIMCARGGADLEETAAAISAKSPARIVTVVADTSEPEGVRAVMDAANGEFGHVDILVTNSGGPPAGKFETHDAAAWQAAYESLLGSVTSLVREAMPGMKERGWGRIINVTSIAVKQPVDDLILSNSLRAGVTGFEKTLSNEVARFGITVNNVMPGYTRTDRLEQLAARVARAKGVPESEMLTVWNDEIPAGRIGEPSELAGLVAFLASDRAAYITGQSIAVDGGWIRSLL